MKLTPKQEKFCLEFVNCAGNATEAARRAGYKGNENQLAQIGFQNLRKLNIQERIKELKAMLRETDYAVIKIAEGAATVEEYAKLISDREAWRLEINELGG